MKRKLKMLLGTLLAGSSLAQGAYASFLPPDFVYLKDVDKSIVQEIRYAGDHNFLGRPIEGYEAKECILTREAAEALKQVQAELRKVSLSLKVYDCYRPQRAVNDFIRWSKEPDQQQMKQEFYPQVNKAEVFQLGYVAKKSGHSRGSTMDLTIVPLPLFSQESYHRGQQLRPCFAPSYVRFRDNSLDMGTGYDCLDETAHIDYQKLSSLQQYNRLLLSKLMLKYGFVPYPEEWWHFTLKKEPYPKTYFNFPVK